MASFTPRRCSGRVRKPTFKLRENEENEVKAFYSEEKSHPGKGDTSKHIKAKMKSVSCNSKALPELQNNNPGSDQEVNDINCDVDDHRASEGFKTALPCDRSQTKSSPGTLKYQHEMSLNSDGMPYDQVDVPKLHYMGIKNENAICDKLTEGGLNTNQRAENGSSCQGIEPSNLERDINGKGDACNVYNSNSVMVKTESEILSDVSDLNESVGDNLRHSIGSQVDDIDHVITGLKTDGSATECGQFEDNSEGSLVCSICSKSFSSRQSLKKHMLLHADKKPYQCEICGLSFALRTYLTTHKLVHSGVRSHKCHVCEKQFLRRTNLNSHMKTHTDLKTYKCDICSRDFKTKLGKDCHHKLQHNGGFVCHTCGKSYSHQTYLRKHLSIHAGEKPYKCGICEKSFSYNQSLQEHMRRHQGDKPEVCDQCGKRFNNKRELRHHSKYHENTSGHACTECNVRYDTLQSLNKHMSKTHKKTHNCMHCEESFVNKKHLRSHLFRQHRDKQSQRRPEMDLAKVKKVVCSICEKTFFNRYVLSKHLVAMHQLSESVVKKMLHIRKKAVGKPVGESTVMEDKVKEFPASLDNDKSFQVYYKDEEMAVYVKRMDDYDNKVRHQEVSCEKEKSVDGDFADAGVQYIVVEEDKIIENELSEIDYNGMVNGKLTEDLKNATKVETSIASTDVHSEVVQAEGVASGQNIENNYVVISDHHEHSQNLGEQVVGESEMFEISNNGSERIVLILNDGPVGNEIIFDSSEQFEIVESEAHIDKANANKKSDEMEINSGRKIGNEYEIVANAHSITSKFSEVVLNELRDGKERVAVTETSIVEVINECTKSNINERNEMEKYIPTHLQSVEASSYPVVEQNNFNNVNDSLKSGFDTNEVSQPSASTDNIAMETGESYLSIMPKNNSMEEFSKFEKAIKTKVVEFQDNTEYVAFIDKMIQSLQNAKHTSFQ